ncbi:thermonuclease family protein [Pelagicoccus albus]|uniref:Thermonuclease family protein n=1 Tax=Pelagicoccus albus TaxID=415222 RepID=A0A7X1B4S7_9BACT|nr:thermonuclease family protein [Pelagicoccus albus]MBC2605409.1 thermonuclease family protein [Pelagicoccus albus]
MIFGFIIIACIAIGLVFLTLRTSSTTQTAIVDVIGALDGRTVEVMNNKHMERVILAGIGFPPGDSRSESESAEVVQDVVAGRRLYMEVFKEVSGCKYVTLRSSNGDCLNTMMLRRGLARYESAGAGFISELVEAENEARASGVGVWDKNRALFRQVSGNEGTESPETVLKED